MKNIIRAVAAVVMTLVATLSVAESYTEPYRPQYQFTPAKNWMNDPNGLVYFRGEYHMFYQYNPYGMVWGNISWGHAVSPDLVHWTELPVALLAEKDASGNITQMFFSGSAVVDEKNTSGFGQPGNPAMVAVFTSFYPTGKTLPDGTVLGVNTQAQSIAYSLDRGRTWTQYAANPVIPLPPAPYQDQFRDFRDPKVFWYEPGKKWIMAAVLSALHKAVFFSSSDLKTWTFMSEFGPANAVGGVWECPDLFELPVDADPAKRKWVLTINLNPGSIAGGSGAQYFVGNFDGHGFVAEDVIDTLPPPGPVFQDFEGASYAGLGWTGTGQFAGAAPAAGNLPGQGGVSGFVGLQLANSFIGGDAGTGTLTSPVFTVSSPYIDMLVGGGNHPHDPNTGTGAVPAGDLLFSGADFEGPSGVTYEQLGWTASGDLVGQVVPTGAIGDQQAVSGFQGARLANTFVGSTLGVGGDAPQGALVSPTFTITHPYINFLVGGGGVADGESVVLKVNGNIVRTSGGQEDEVLNWVNWNVAEFVGQQAEISIVDASAGGWGHINADQFMGSELPAQPLSRETAVNLLVGGKVVRSATGANSETLSWKTWNVSAFAGQPAQIQIVDNNTGGFGHVLADQIVFSNERKDEANWVDFGSDFYAAVSWNDVPFGRRIWVGWMSNWNYGGQTPTTPWRSAQTIPHELGLSTIDGRIRLVQRPIAGLSRLRSGPVYQVAGQTIPVGSTPLSGPGSTGKAMEILAELQVGSASQVGLKVRTGVNGDETLVGYDAKSGEVFVDRTRSGRADFNSTFAARHSAPLAAVDGVVRLHILVDWSSVEVFSGKGEVVITDQIFPDPASVGVATFAQDGSATLRYLRVWPLRSAWPQP